MVPIDSNVPMYLVGATHAHKIDAQRALERLISERHRLVTDAEVLQEILHRHVAINRRDAIQHAPRRWCSSASRGQRVMRYIWQ